MIILTFINLFTGITVIKQSGQAGVMASLWLDKKWFTVNKAVGEGLEGVVETEAIKAT